MSNNQPDDQNEPVVISYDQQYEVLAAAHRDDGDPTVFVFENYLKWKGMPLNGARLQVASEYLSRHFAVLEYSGNDDFHVYCTLGASCQVIPHSQNSFDDRRGVRYEYLMHAPTHHQDAVIDLLGLVAEFPFEHHLEVGPGFVLPIGEPIIDGSGIEYLYYTYPYLDDHKLMSNDPWGQIERGKSLIQVLWMMPLYLSEVQFLRAKGVDAFEDLCAVRHARRYDMFDFMREPYV